MDDLRGDRRRPHRRRDLRPARDHHPQVDEREYANVDPGEVRIILLDAGERLVAAFAEELSEKVAEQLSALDVIVRERARATVIDAHGVTIEAGEGTERIAARTVIWAAGVPPAVRRHARQGHAGEHGPRRAPADRSEPHRAGLSRNLRDR